MTPLAGWRFLAEAQAVMLRRGLALWADPLGAAPALWRLAAEKQGAFAEGAVAAGFAAAAGRSPEAIAAAALRPARRRVRRNLRGTGHS